MKIVEIISQSDVMRALLRDKDALGTFAAVRTVEELFGRKDVLAVPSDMPAIAVRLVASKTIGSITSLHHRRLSH
jgi:molybdopterin-guanine dinucleotide biosynthesis protein A